LPAYKGLNTHARVLADGGKEHGCSVHYMRAEMDDGPIILQKRVPVHGKDTADTLSARVLKLEHIAYPEALDIVIKKLNKS
ncbi:MAG: formyltransferase family protein, partial [Pseudomonadota bacterium]|nr:formyltransferase family protein [Pseudomonadota bacterium]